MVALFILGIYFLKNGDDDDKKNHLDNKKKKGK